MPVRERPIVDEAGETGRIPGRVILGFFVAAVLAVPIVQLVWEAVSGERFQEFDIFRRIPTLANITRYEDALADSCITADSARPGVQWTQLTLMHQGNEKVVVARNGWLFYRPGIFYVTGPPFRSVYALEDVAAKHPDPLPAILDFDRQLSERGIGLVIVPVPVKPQIYPERLARSYDVSKGPPANSYEKEFFKELRMNGIPVINLARNLWDAKRDDGLVYMPLDTHWTPYGMSVFAKALAAELKEQYPWLREPEREYRTRPLEVSNKGDLFDMLELPGWSQKFPESTITVEQVVDAETGELVKGDPKSPVILLGDSFANVFSVGMMKWGDHAGLGEHLAMHLGRSLDVIAVNGGAPTVTRRNLARRGSLGGKRLVIWTFATRDFIDPASEWEIVKLREAGAHPAKGPIEVKAKVLLASKPPRPGQDPYAHCATVTQYRILALEKGEYDDDVLIAVQWVMRDFKLLPAANIKRGDVHYLSLVPYREDLDPGLPGAGWVDDTGDTAHAAFWVVETRKE